MAQIILRCRKFCDHIHTHIYYTHTHTHQHPMEVPSHLLSSLTQVEVHQQLLTKIAHQEQGVCGGGGGVCVECVVVVCL